jgi:hypothetical protein
MPQTAATSGPTLTNITYFGRIAVKVAIITLVTLMVGRVAVTAFVAYWRAVNPEPPPPPTIGFGILPKIEFPPQTAGEKPTSYTLETATGRLPDFGDRAKVFLFLKSSPSLLADEQARKVAAGYGFVFAPEIINSDRYRWTNTQQLVATLDMDINTLHFTLTTDYLSRPELLSNSQLPSNFDATNSVRNFLSSASLLPPDAATSSGKLTFLKATGGQLERAVSLSDADYLQVDLTRTPIDGQLPIFTPQGTKGTIHAIVSGSQGYRNGIVHFEFVHHTIDYTQVHTYPLRSTSAAWEEVKAGNAYVVSKSTTEATIVRTVTLGYYDDPAGQDFLQPIYVFEGDGGFMAFVSALDPRYVQQSY